MKPAASRWLQLAEIDLKAAKMLLKDTGLTPVVCFHAQQCVEKSLKALIEFESLNPPKSHDLVLLHARVADLIQLDEDLLSKLNQVYIDARYPASVVCSLTVCPIRMKPRNTTITQKWFTAR